MDNVGRVIQDFYCNGFAGRRYDLSGATIEVDGDDYIILRTADGYPVYIEFLNYENDKPTKEGWQYRDKQKLIDNWCKPEEHG